jgi:hypothetical protein
MADSLVPRRIPLLDGLMTSVGPISPARLQRLRRVLTTPTQETWDDAYSIILRHEPSLHLTLWKAVLAVAPDFPREKPLEDRCPQVPDHSRAPCATRARRSRACAGDGAQRYSVYTKRNVQPISLMFRARSAPPPRTCRSSSSASPARASPSSS